MSEDPQRQPNRRWYPSERTQALEFYLRMLMRYVVGGGAFAWELALDKGRNPLVLLIAAMLATSTDVVGVVRGLVQQAKAEQKSLEDLIDDDRRRDREWTTNEDDRGSST